VCGVCKVCGVGVGAVCNSPLRLAMLSALYIKVKPLQLARQRLIILCRQSVVCFVAELHSYALAWEQGVGNWESGICCGLVMDSADQLAHAWLIDFGKNYPRILVPMGLVSGNRNHFRSPLPTHSVYLFLSLSTCCPLNSLMHCFIDD